jgi:phage terminase large subunit-like protein
MAFGKSSQAHYTALVVMAYCKGKFYLLQSYLKRGTSKVDKAKMIGRAKREFPFMNMVYIESDLTQSDYIEDLKKLVDCGVMIEEHLSRHEESKIKRAIDIGNLESKHARIVAQLDDIIETKKFVVNRNMNHFEEFERELKEFPQSQYDDLIDAIGSCVSQLKKRRYKLFCFSG